MLWGEKEGWYFRTHLFMEIFVKHKYFYKNIDFFFVLKK